MFTILDTNHVQLKSVESYVVRIEMAERLTTIQRENILTSIKHRISDMLECPSVWITELSFSDTGTPNKLDYFVISPKDMGTTLIQDLVHECLLDILGEKCKGENHKIRIEVAPEIRASC